MILMDPTSRSGRAGSAAPLATVEFYGEQSLAMPVFAGRRVRGAGKGTALHIENPLAGVGQTDLDITDFEMAGRRLLDQGHQTGEGRLATAGLPDHGERPSGAQAEAGVVERAYRPS